MSVTELEQLCQKQGVEASDLDELVHDLKSREASNTNNGGLQEQLPFILSHLGTEGAKQAIKAASEIVT